MNNKLVVYFSHAKENYVSGKIVELEVGNTKVVAQKLQVLLDSDIFEMQPLKEYPKNYRECTKVAQNELGNNVRPKLLNVISHMEQYEHIYLGYPNWWGTMPMCVWTFLESYDLANKHLHPFCTHEGSGLGQSIQDIKKLCPNSYVEKGLALFGSQVKEADASIRDWLKEE